MTFLGSGTSQGVPMIACDCAVCRSEDPRDNRCRSSIYLESPESRILVDTTPDLRFQAIRAGLKDVDAVLLTHSHADHVLGFDDLRRFCERLGKRLPVYGLPETLQALAMIFPYAFDPKVNVAGYVRVDAIPMVETQVFGGWEFTAYRIVHGATPTCGYLFKRDGRKVLAYFCDCAGMSDEVVESLKGVEVLVLDGLRDQPHPTHFHVAAAVAMSQRIQARRTWLTHLTHHKSHVDRERDLPSGISVAYDGLVIDLMKDGFCEEHQ